ncbi:hypothetical protein [Flavobacterium terrisoli]|uniref:hypothetical protein n=1 Tax=Flavobacterium terrisoli TaxID=3242195 RepID=UPI0025433EFD|nr:hypothetical protein [Flavobacterium buctense]
MENQDIFNQFKKAADNAESPDFASMEKVWSRVEEKLDKKELKKASQLWKKWAVAASILLGISIGYQFLNNGEPTTNTDKIVTENDTLQKGLTPKEAVVSTETVHPDIKKEAGDILKVQINTNSQVAWADSEEITVSENLKADDVNYNMTVEKAPVISPAEEISHRGDDKSKDLEVFMNKENKVSSARKEKPLLVYDNLSTNKQTVKEVEMDEIESIIELPDPLYIINGIEYTEQELFGPKPTSPYAPLTEQDIDSISVLQNEKAISIYGEKGKKGVVIISTKNGKPKAKKGK